MASRPSNVTFIQRHTDPQQHPQQDTKSSDWFDYKHNAMSQRTKTQNNAEQAKPE